MMAETEYKFKTFWITGILLVLFLILFGILVPYPYIFVVMIFPIPFTLLVMRISKRKHIEQS